jgi:hypothetical protein
METFVKGKPKYNTDHFKTFAEIHEMAEKPGWIGKTISLKDSHYLNWENLKTNVIKSTQLIDKYLAAYLPNYYYTFEEGENEKSKSVVYFMEEVEGDRSLPPAKEVDNFFAACCQMFIDTTVKGESFMVDINKIENLIYGHTNDKHQSKLYFVDFFPFHLSSSLQSRTIGKILQSLSEFAKIYGESSFPKTKALIGLLNQLEYSVA